MDLDTLESEKAYSIKVDLPGLSKSDIKVTVRDQILTIIADRQTEVVKQFYSII